MNPIPMASKNYQKIIQFYLLECPVRTRKPIPKADRDPDDKQAKYKFLFKPVSHRGITFADRKLVGPKLNTLRAAMMKVAPVKLYHEEQLDEHSVPTDKEYIVIKKNEQNISVTEGYFYCIRNAFAHGSFDIEGKVYKLRNEDRNVLKGLAVLKEKTLLAWIDLVNSPLEEIQAIARKR